MIRRPPRTPAFLLAALMPLAAQAGIFETSSPDPSTRLKTEPQLGWKDDGSKTTWAMPSLSVDLPLQPGLHANVSSGYGRVESDGGDRAREGLADSKAGFKWRFYENRAALSRLALGVEPKLGIPTADDGSGLGANCWKLALPLLAAYEAGRLRLEGQLGYTHAFGGQDDDILLGALALVTVTPRLKLGGEIVEDSPADDIHRRQVRANLGLKYRLMRDLELHGLAGRSIDNHRGDTVEQARMILQMLF
jgi:hypothetical protein